MANEADLILALEFVTRGAEAIVPEELQPEALPSPSLMAAAEKVREKSRDWTTERGVQGLGIGTKISKGQPTEELAMRVYVERKEPRADLGSPVPKTVSVPEVGKVPTDVIEIGKVEPETFRERVRPAMPGSGLGHPDVTVGTFGCLVRRKGGGDGGLYILSNSHVLANSGLATIGDKVVQPGDADGGKEPGDVLATLVEFVPFDFSEGYPNLADAAIAEVRSQSVRPELRILGIRPVGVSHTLRRGMTVKKVGRTTDFTTGVVQDLHYRMRLSYPTSKAKPPATRAAGLRDLVLCTRYTAGGDSGSLVLNNRNRAVGLHFAGSPSSSIFCRIRNVFTALNVELA